MKIQREPTVKLEFQIFKTCLILMQTLFLGKFELAFLK